MARVIGVYALVLACVCGALIILACSLGYATGNVLTYVSAHTYEASDVFMFDLSSGRTIRLTYSTNIVELEWSHNGARFATTSDGIGMFPYITVWDRFATTSISFWSELGALNHPNWLQDNQTILFELLPTNWSEIYTTDINDPQNWTLFIGSENVYGYGDMTLSPDENLIAYGDFNSGIYVLDVNTQTTEHLIPDAGGDAAWSADGQFIAYYATIAYASNIYVFDTQTETSRQLTNSSFHDRQPAWSPDGTQIAFVSDRDGDDEIFIMNADGTNVRQVTFNDVNDSQPAWVP